MLLRLKVLLIAAGLLLVGNGWADIPDIIAIYDHEKGALLIEGNAGAPPPLVIVRGEIVAGGGTNGGPPDCSKAENRPICVSLSAVLESYSGQEGPEIIIINSGGGAYLLSGNSNAPPPLVVVNGKIVAGG